MKYRKFGTTDLLISTHSFGAWGIGGNSYGPVDRKDAIAALSVADEYGCNFVDTAEVYNDSEKIIGEFIKTRRDRWIVSSKYSGQYEGLPKTLERQLKTLKTDYLDFYQIHWAPKSGDALYEDLYMAKENGKVRYVGVSLHNKGDIKNIINNPLIDGFQVACNLIEPYPYAENIKLIENSKKGVLVRSTLKSGLLTGKYNMNSRFDKNLDQRSKMTKTEIDKTLFLADEFNFLKKGSESLLFAAARYPLVFPETTSVLLGTKNASQATTNFKEVAEGCITDIDYEQIVEQQKKLHLFKGNKIENLYHSLMRKRLLNRELKPA